MALNFIMKGKCKNKKKLTIKRKTGNFTWEKSLHGRNLADLTLTK